MPEEETKTPRRGRRRKTQAKPKAEPAAASPSVQPEVNEEKKSVLLATGLEDYARWKVMFKDQKPDNDPPFRRGRIWA
ncbi:MAG: cyanobactin biosynthesis PatC/TenC/TruC family protein [Moorea sp. SIO1F2]|uniref:cyanobactin biosynthesis PatC/TenC/TruC family protein n=1 Tax=unclassified Moorena TaxID=2683338 RepID=UPI0013B89F72|nr:MULTISPECIES: cyanobactin biosynthesis PatC/TenC/TruC family protein [unclassified Moorena]NEO02066.1 cyanobactin biosynthesis PatC/TenC/TruC family protein [Moorena sp. SIO3I7]NEO90274.1 cyanobactin biosynthesis PatC/TenC/TruC family protein [Moorena sp. SIO3G5]NEO04597.1 cyanobactin biosynthesis PatC/TenC/TruC family protein [Moorena sp. SIO3I8]NEO20020.1 cyanobactin biosynthesis PatC/TenC/TruC family protein [Moorena sp. SIO4A5]NEP21200.1 cyanobactin biosynthesis PatC/TenC/TruC family pr